MERRWRAALKTASVEPPESPGQPLRLPLLPEPPPICFPDRGQQKQNHVQSVTHGSYACDVHLQKWQQAVHTGCQAARFKNRLRSGFCGFLAIWAVTK